MAARSTGKALIDFWQSPIVENTVSARTAADLATACREVLGAQPDGENLNLRTCPVDDLLDRYAGARPQARAGTLAAYKSRFKKAVRLYLAYQDDPDAWPTNNAKPAVETEAAVKLYDYNFPLRAGIMLPLSLPVDLTTAEAKRLAAFIESLVVG